ncbi:TetR/AcrR family transcriptional regulator [Lysinibacter sp. HNR]|uniref:TetR/AcrR family transcriptional regulator n=1 Tax=Lysinibacter sp. HNR TaxID=3031408 RepID=UPI0024356AC8|nr:TetR/AcrR family transcriptional regulator [Lysinibacter sp. HNR]WGD37600.1 TetR/AcrR family transcriptional regulator [Lysinibacter sp. HNR]
MPETTSQPTTDDVRTRIIKTADELFYSRGIQAVGMDEIRTVAEVSLKRLYAEFPGKDKLIVAVLGERHTIWEHGITLAVDAATTPRDKLLAMYDFLESWFSDTGFRGCGFINAFGELGATSSAVSAAAKQHKQSFQESVIPLAADVVPNTALAHELAAQLALLAEGAQTTAAIAGTPKAAIHARRAAATLIDATIAQNRRNDTF